MYSVKFQNSAQRALEKLDEPTREKIIKWITETLDGCENPRLHGKWSYRVGDYRIVAEIQDDKILILIVDVAHRSKVYR